MTEQQGTGKDYLRTWLGAFAANVKRQAVSAGDSVMTLDEARCSLGVEERRADLIRSAARGQGPTFIAAKLDMLIAAVMEAASSRNAEAPPLESATSRGRGTSRS